MNDSVADTLANVAEPLRSDAERLLGISPLFSTLVRNLNKTECEQLFRPLDSALLPEAGDTWVPACDSTQLVDCMRHLRQCKQKGMRHLIWWELGVHGDIDASCRAIADFGAALMQEAFLMAARLLMPRYGEMTDGRYCIIGLGKMGGRELNLGSDIDPLMIWQAEGSTSGGRNSVPAKEYYAHLTRMIIRLLDERTTDGQVWPIDMRLRPGGDGSAVALSLEATLAHYQEYGQTWERAMLIKARPVAGDLALGEELIEELGSFIYRRYLDYTTVAALADMKGRIDRQAGQHDISAGFDVKKGKGGIREIEFVIQSLQLIHAGRNRSLRMQPSLEALQALEDHGLISSEDACALATAYRFWRRIEHAVQVRKGEQTQKLPDAYAEYLQLALGESCMGGQTIDLAMAHHASVVEQAFSRQVLPIEGADSSDHGWLSGGARDRVVGVDDESARRMLLALERVDTALARGLLPERCRIEVERILTHAMPAWLDDENGVTALEAFARLIHSIAGRATWIDLLATHRGALDWLIGALSASQYVADHIVTDPSWLEWPLMTEHADTDIARICAELNAIDPDPKDVEQVLADVGRWVDRARLLSALAVDAHTADAMTIGGWLSDTADAATAAVLRLCLKEMQLPADFPFVALAMGKHGSGEMGLVSDLDMVFVLVHDQSGEMQAGRSMGEHAQRIGRRMIQYLTGKPPFGAGYEFDARLRPSGSSGVLVTSLNGFVDYQHHEAQTWEHQALCRARAVAGPQNAMAMVEAAVTEVINIARDHQQLAVEVRAMRSKMLEHLSSKSDAVINLKQDAGGLVDIEFLAQFARLAYAIPMRRTVDILRAIPDTASGTWQQNGAWLAETYLDYREMENALRVELWRSIGNLPTDAEATEWETMRRHVVIKTPEALQERMQQVHELFQSLLAQ